MFKEEGSAQIVKNQWRSFRRILVYLMMIIGGTEAIVMTLIDPLGISDTSKALLDAFLLSAILAPVIIYVFLRDATLETEHSLIESLQASDDLLRAMPAGIYMYRFIQPDQLILIDANQAAEDMTGRKLKDWKGKAFDEIWPAARGHGITETFLNVAKTGVPHKDENVVYKDDTLVFDSMNHVFMLSQDKLVVSFIDITERKRAENELRALAGNLEVRVEERTAELRQLNTQLRSEIEERKEVEDKLDQVNKKLALLSYQDGLTRVANRRMFDRRLQEEWRRCGRNESSLSIVMIDIDYFKQYNDHYGHQLGDQCLQLVASALAGVASRPADLLARYGGEEFVLLLPETNENQAYVLAERCRQNVLQLKIAHDQSSVEEVVTISLGVQSCVPKQDMKSSTLIEQADKLLYKAKESGRNSVVVDGLC